MIIPNIYFSNTSSNKYLTLNPTKDSIPFKLQYIAFKNYFYFYENPSEFYTQQPIQTIKNDLYLTFKIISKEYKNLILPPQNHYFANQIINEYHAYKLLLQTLTNQHYKLLTQLIHKLIQLNFDKYNEQSNPYYNYPINLN